jgi:hypothetical protein
LSGSDHFLLGNGLCVKEGLHRCFAKAPSALMRPVSIELFEPSQKAGMGLGRVKTLGLDLGGLGVEASCHWRGLFELADGDSAT